MENTMPQTEKFKVKLIMTKIMEVDPTSYPVEMGITTKEQMIADTKQSLLNGELWIGDLFDGSNDETIEVVEVTE